MVGSKRVLPSGALEDPESVCPFGPQNHPIFDREVKVDLSLHERKNDEAEEVSYLEQENKRSN